MNWQQWVLLLVTFVLGIAGGFSVADAKRKQLSDRCDWLQVALGKLTRACEGDTCTLGSKAINDALDFARKVLDGETPQAKGQGTSV